MLRKMLPYTNLLMITICLLTAHVWAADACSPTKPTPKNSNVRIPDVGKPTTPLSGVSNGWVLLYEDDSYSQLSDEVFCQNNKIQFSSSDGETNFNNNPDCSSTPCTRVIEKGTLTTVVLTGTNGNTNTFLWKGDFPFFSVLHAFAGGPGDGAYPNGPLTRDAVGNLYGATTYGGSNVSSCGTIFKVAPSGKATVLYNFTGSTDGCHPNGGLARDSAGNLYGTTSDAGDPACPNPDGTQGCGVVFKVDTNNVETVLLSFTGLDGAGPRSGVIRDSSGNLYGTTYYGGLYGLGTVYKVLSKNVATVLWNFTGTGDGARPEGERLLMDSSRNLYGTAFGGGLYQWPDGYGTVFKVDQSGHETTLYTFPGTADDGCFPAGALAMDAAGNLYGTTSGCGYNYGTVWQLSGPNEFVMHYFAGPEGATPAGVILDASGNMYGATVGGGGYGEGVLYQVTPSGTLTVLYDFRGGTDGCGPGMPILDPEGYLWGVTNPGVSSCYPNGGALWGFDLK